METSRSHITGYKTYAFIWGLLLLLTAATITVARMHLTHYAVLISLAIASVKALLVLAFYMHLRYEGVFLKSVVFLGIVTLTVIIGLTFVDVWYR